MYKIEFTKDSLKYLKRLDKPTTDRIMQAINELPNGDVKKLQASEYFRLRVGDYRIIFSKDNKNFEF